MASLAQTGPITHSTNAENEPRNAMTVENSGTRIDTPTARKANTTRSMTSNQGWGVVRAEVESVAAVFEMGEAGRDGDGGLAGLSIPSQISTVRLSYVIGISKYISFGIHLMH
jgi:hypothetical protein